MLKDTHPLWMCPVEGGKQINLAEIYVAFPPYSFRGYRHCGIVFRLTYAPTRTQHGCPLVAPRQESRGEDRARLCELLCERPAEVFCLRRTR
jgi:hypothetical protein